ncbi:hypothetical protein AAL_02638 [Moelleriella libera RCEF 2490]|uniref:Uncharacterized protein n=1 Tax=Moelleriella libera RCEF 2490 TaxID=1081109 RepID=A0A168ERY9_9HYPO|nr:hypothetical protein AAL_02638 [Moelleriella libera RCEF 2490]
MRRAVAESFGFVCESCAPSWRTHSSFFRAVLAPTSQTSRRTCLKSSSTRWASTAATVAAVDPSSESPSPSHSRRNATAAVQVLEPAELARLAQDSNRKFMSIDGIPTSQLTQAALQSCLRAAASLNPQLKRAESQSKASASKLVTLGAERTGARIPVDARIQDAANKISQAAYSIISHPNVEMKPEFLELYVHVQAQLGRPESLPSVLELYATKPKPVVRDGEITHIKQASNAASRAIEESVASMALQTAIDARNLDASLGIIEAAYCVPAFKRQKLIRHGTAPAMGLATLPFGIVGLSTAYAAYWQNTMDISTATGIGIAGISGYLFVVGSLGVIAKLSNKDRMRRVTWAPGTPLRYRWLREDERAALDKVACAWGFKEPWRHGEETGPEWEGLREYMGYRQMLLDRVEFMDGMG